MRWMFRSSGHFAVLFVMSGILFGAGIHEDESEPAPAQSTAKQKAKKVYTNEDLKSLKDTTRVNQSPATSRTQKSGKPSAGIENYRDTGGHDREYWQKRIRPLNNQLETLDSQIAAQQAKYDRLECCQRHEAFSQRQA